jgi:hypothetical protein
VAGARIAMSLKMRAARPRCSRRRIFRSCRSWIDVALVADADKLAVPGVDLRQQSVGRGGDDPRRRLRVADQYEMPR